MKNATFAAMLLKLKFDVSLFTTLFVIHATKKRSIT